MAAAPPLSAHGTGIAAPPPVEWQTSYGIDNRVESSANGSRVLAQTSAFG